MKAISLFFFGVIIFASLAFAFIYTFWMDVVEANPAIFAIGLIGTTIIGMIGMMYNLMNEPAAERIR